MTRYKAKTFLLQIINSPIIDKTLRAGLEELYHALCSDDFMDCFEPCIVQAGSDRTCIGCKHHIRTQTEEMQK